MYHLCPGLVCFYTEGPNTK